MKKEWGGGKEEASEVDIQDSLEGSHEVRHGFLSLKGFWIQERTSPCFPENTEAFGAPLLHRVNTVRLGWRILYHILVDRTCRPPGSAGPAGLPETTGGLRGPCLSRDTSLGWPCHFLLSLPIPTGTWGYHGHRNHRTKMQSYFLPLSALPPFAECIVTIHVTK